MAASGDVWARWVLAQDSGGGEPAGRAAGPLAGYREGVLGRAGVAEGDVLLDVGAGAGLIGLGALDRVGPGGQVIFSDISAELLAECRRRAEALGAVQRCRFVQAGAEDLGEIADRSVDVVTTRSVLIYVSDRPAAFAEFFRVLRPGGRLSIFEPINRFAVGEPRRVLFGLDLAPVADLAGKLASAYARRPPEQDPMLNFDERDLLRWVRDAGFAAVELDYRAEVEVPQPLPATDWDTLKQMAPNPLAPTYEQAMTEALTPDERARLEDHIRATLAAGGTARRTLATAYLRATRP
jgi:arsenite methyltransferase